MLLKTARRRTAGRVRIRLAQMLEHELRDHYAEGVTVDPEMLTPANPRENHFTGCALWSGLCRLKRRTGLLFTICSWDTMSRCVSRGFTIEYSQRADPKAFADFEVHAR